MPSLYYKNDSTWEQIQLVSFPVGAIYMSYTSTSPASFIGGSWTQIKDTFLLAAGSTYSATDTGGEATHALTVDEMAKHNHGMWVYNGGDYTTTYKMGLMVDAFGRDGYVSGVANSTGSSGTKIIRATKLVGSGNRDNESERPIDYTGESTAHNNMPPYLVVYIWRRTA